MKEFIKYTLATVTGIVLLCTSMAVLGLFSVFAMLATGSSTPKVAPNSVLAIKLSGTVEERANDNMTPVFRLMGSDMETMGLDQIVGAIRKAKGEGNVKGIYIEAGPVTFDSPATAAAIRKALADFKKSGKWVVAYGDEYTQAAYYIASVADKVYLNTTGMIDFRGMGSKIMYLKGLYDKIGVRYQATRVGKYKSYVEQQTRTGMSAEDREQRTAYLSGIWQAMLRGIAASRKVSAKALNGYANDSILLFADQKDYQKMKLVDKLLYPEELQQEIKGRLGLEKDDDITQVSVTDMGALPEPHDGEGDEIAVYYAVGGITDQDISAITGEQGIVGRTMAEDLGALADDDNVKAVVIRVNSGGGSATASEQIWHAVKKLRQRKPVVVSMGGMAASGGYMISCAANYIIAEPQSVTGSIGIFGLIPNVSGLMTDKLGITFSEVGTNRYTNAMENLTMDKDNTDVLNMMQTYVDRGYDRFLAIVADGRKMTKRQVHAIAQGRVWLGADAARIKLVDRLGSLDDAVAKAASLAKAGSYHTTSYPAQSSWWETLLQQQMGSGNYLDAGMRELLGSNYGEWVALRTADKRGRLQAALPFSVTIE